MTHHRRAHRASRRRSLGRRPRLRREPTPRFPLRHPSRNDGPRLLSLPDRETQSSAVLFVRAGLEVSPRAHCRSTKAEAPAWKSSIRFKPVPRTSVPSWPEGRAHRDGEPPEVREKAHYKDGRPCELSGQEAYQLYATEMKKLAEGSGGRFLFGDEVESLLLGEAEHGPGNSRARRDR